MSTDEKKAPSLASSQSHAHIEPLEVDESLGQIAEKRLVRKLDFHILPLISILHLLSFLDRSNFGNAKAAGMTTTLHLPSYGYNVAAALFYVFYAAFEVPSNLLMKKIGPNRWFPFQVVCWGIVCLTIAFTQNFAGLCIVRVFLGITEAGLFPGLGYYISLWYKRKELAWRIAIFYASTTSSGAFGGILTYGIMKIHPPHHWGAWRLIFIIEGAITIAAGLFAFWGMVGLPEDAKFLSEDERKVVLRRLEVDREGHATHYSKEFVIQGLTDWKTYLYAVIYQVNCIPVYALSLFLPSIIANLGYTNADAQLMSVPPYVVAMCGALAFAWISDKKGLRGPSILVTEALAIIGFAVLLGTNFKKQPKLGYMGTFFTCTGTYSTVPVLLSWAANNTGGDTKKGVRIAMMVGLGNLGGIVASFSYRDQDKSKGYKLGHKVMIAGLCMSWTAALIAILAFRQVNKKKEERCKAEGITEDRRMEFVNEGDNSPLYKLSL
ncbi:MFS general substrate transporter [Clavulina sp. PMI_390]|nr:MFS general substrate transporter [Clavulina sp. PMI_390]